jgi:hypothetical protein
MHRKRLVLMFNCVINADHVIIPRDFLASFSHGDFPHKKISFEEPQRYLTSIMQRY